MAACVPVRDMKDTAAFGALVEREGDVAVTKNGYSAFHCLSEQQYQHLLEEAAKARLLARMLLAEKEIESGDYRDFSEFSKEVRAEYGL